jgi:hypothetical protein
VHHIAATPSLDFSESQHSYIHLHHKEANELVSERKVPESTAVKSRGICSHVHISGMSAHWDEGILGREAAFYLWSASRRGQPSLRRNLRKVSQAFAQTSGTSTATKPMQTGKLRDTIVDSDDSDEEPIVRLPKRRRLNGSSPSSNSNVYNWVESNAVESSAGKLAQNKLMSPSSVSPPLLNSKAKINSVAPTTSHTETNAASASDKITEVSDLFEQGSNAAKPH